MPAPHEPSAMSRAGRDASPPHVGRSALRRRYLLVHTLSTGAGAGALVLCFRRHTAGILLMWFVGLLATWLVARWSRHALRRRLRRLREAAEAIGRGELDHRIDLRGHDDFAKLADALDSMAARLETHLIEREELQKNLARAEKLACLGELAATVAHEVNNPLDGLQNALRIIRSRQVDDHQTVRLMSLMQDGLARIERLVQRLVGLACSDPPRMEAVRVDAVLDDVLPFAQPRLGRNGIQLDRQVSSSAPMVCADRTQLGQALTNLMLNAADAMPAGGRLTIVARPGAEPGWVAVEIADTGGGISAEHLPRIFEPFFTTKTCGKGTGLGLAVVARIIEAHAGRITVDSQAGHGTTFCLHLPAASAVDRTAGALPGAHGSGADAAGRTSQERSPAFSPPAR